MKTRFLALVTLWTTSTWAACPVSTSTGSAAGGRGDYLARLFEGLPECPQNVRALIAATQADGLRTRSHMVNNRSFHNPEPGSFSFFEALLGRSHSTGLELKDGEFFFGHFTTLNDGGQVALDQAPAGSSLMIELIAWDSSKGVFNFYELIGSAAQARWFYRGDSLDILADNRWLHRDAPAGVPKFGDRLRCSACHANGGPILKEASAPHNDWWMAERPLPLPTGGADAEVSARLVALVSASQLRTSMEAGVQKLMTSPTYRAKHTELSLQEHLRPLFCPQEMQFASDSAPLEGASDTIAVPAAFFADAQLGADMAPMRVSKRLYRDALAALDAKFPEVNRRDADHAWLAPVKASTDRQAIAALVASGVVNTDFVADVLAVDSTNPALSAGRCALLKAVPEQAVFAWQNTYTQNIRRLAAGSGNPVEKAAANELLENITQLWRNVKHHEVATHSYLQFCRKKLAEATDLTPWMRLLDQRRREVRESEISKNPRGQILEPGFRVIFPEFRRADATKRWKLNEFCDVVPAN